MWVVWCLAKRRYRCRLCMVLALLGISSAAKEKMTRLCRMSLWCTNGPMSFPTIGGLFRQATDIENLQF